MEGSLTERLPQGLGVILTGYPRGSISLHPFTDKGIKIQAYLNPVGLGSDPYRKVSCNLFADGGLCLSFGKKGNIREAIERGLPVLVMLLLILY